MTDNNAILAGLMSYAYAKHRGMKIFSASEILDALPKEVVEGAKRAVEHRINAHHALDAAREVRSMRQNGGQFNARDWIAATEAEIVALQTLGYALIEESCRIGDFCTAAEQYRKENE